MHNQIVIVPNGETRRSSEQSRGRGGIISRAASFPRLLPPFHLRSCSITSGLVIISARFSRQYSAASKFRKQTRSLNRSRRYGLAFRAIIRSCVQHPLQLHGSGDNYKASCTSAGECLINAIKEIFRLDIFSPSLSI